MSTRHLQYNLRLFTFSWVHKSLFYILWLRNKDFFLLSKAAAKLTKALFHWSLSYHEIQIENNQPLLLLFPPSESDSFLVALEGRSIWLMIFSLWQGNEEQFSLSLLLGLSFTLTQTHTHTHSQWDLHSHAHAHAHTHIHLLCPSLSGQEGLHLFLTLSLTEKY